ncbi:protoheme IX farnesyltransferase [Malonomonas rubra DSM 5091]|uniref:Protoheme IX farnesyltransferase n=1 Tax=Malonomonas rubra DSM 5091 TaxID=1122189 RepID=A0A1M6JHT1_MALRU|nr:protoheme IX farnesyltransferase [Malonomonas rubra]SHJ46254.1 protoheme IX farnesyltransferase [Malonomonas rubra DSM 5091]
MAKLQTTTIPLNQLLLRLNDLRLLTRAELSGMVAFAALTGNLFGAQRWSLESFQVCFAVLLLAAGCSALNQWQERDLDARMQRTRNRPLPAGTLPPSAALFLTAVLLVCGLLLLAFLPSQLPLLLGLLAIIWYNAIYTPLKRVTAFAALPGAICGALPPLIGWTAAGESLLDVKIISLFITLFLWQVPHSWLLLCHYRKDLQLSGLPNLFTTFSTQRLMRINSYWLLALLFCYLQFPLFGYLGSASFRAVFLAGLAAIGLAIFSESRQKQPKAKKLFHLTNLSMTLLLLLLLLDNSFAGF